MNDVCRLLISAWIWKYLDYIHGLREFLKNNILLMPGQNKLMPGYARVWLRLCHFGTLDQRESVLDISHNAHLSVRYKNIAHSKISSLIFDDASYFLDDAKECYSNFS